MPTVSRTHLVIIPSYNPGHGVVATVCAARAQWTPVWVVVYGSNDGSAALLQALAKQDDGLQVIVLPENRGKGEAVLEGISRAAAAGFTHALTMDSDGQHPSDLIPGFMAASQGVPPRWCSATRSSFQGRRRCASTAARSPTAGEFGNPWMGVDDSLFGIRVYPVAPLIRMCRTPVSPPFRF